MKNPDMYNRQNICLPTTIPIKTFLKSISGMGNVPEQLDVFYGNVISVLDNYGTMDDRRRFYINGIMSNYNGSPEDKQRLVNAWSILVDNIHDLYMKLNLWDSNGVAWCAFHAMVGMDIIVNRIAFPEMDSPLNNPITRYHVKQLT